MREWTLVERWRGEGYSTTTEKGKEGKKRRVASEEEKRVWW